MNRESGFSVDETGRDMELASVLSVLDPATTDANYWLRFREWVVDRSAMELARRRLMAQLTVGDVLSSWARALVPTAVLAAALAGLLLVRARTVEVAVPLGVEETTTIEPNNAVLFAAEIF